MTLHTQFQQELTNLGSGGETTISVAADARQIECQLVESNPLAAVFSVLRLTTAELADAAVADLERISQALADRLNYLMEPISPIEIDAEACVVQLRSNPPQRDDDGRSYFELTVRRGGEIALRRFRKENSSARQPVAATVTREVLLRLVGDFSATLD